MSERSFRPTAAELFRASAFKRREAAIAAIVEHYRKPVPQPTDTRVGMDLTDAEIELLKKVLGVTPRGVTRNKYHATRGGAAHRAFEAMRDRGLVVLTVEPGLWVSCEATSAGVTAFLRAIERRAA